MKTVYLLRHAKSDRSASLDDKDRPLNDRGRKSPPMMAAAMLARGYVPEFALVSTAMRTRQTWDLARPVLGQGIATDYRDTLYLASASRIIAALRELEESVSRVIVVGHNPGIEEAAARLSGPPADADGRDAYERLKTKYPTAGLAVLEFPVTAWQDIGPGTGRLTAFVAPSMLKD